MSETPLQISMTHASMRLFFGIGLDSQAKQHIQDWLSQQVESKRAFTKPDNLHLTLAFLGLTPSEFLPELERFAQSLTIEPFTLQFEQHDYWQDTGIFFLKPHTIPSQLAELANALRTKGESMGLYQNPYAFAPHISLSRGNKLKPNVIKPITPFELCVNSFSLYHSHQSEQGLVYEPIARFG
jgi:2'-5' RNA ligase